MTIRVMKVDRVRDLVILEVEGDAARSEVLLRGEKILPTGAKGEVQHCDAAARTRNGIRMMRRENSQSGCAFADKYRHSVPHPCMSPLETEHVDVPLRGASDITDGQSDMVDSLKREHSGSVNCRASRSKSASQQT